MKKIAISAFSLMMIFGATAAIASPVLNPTAVSVRAEDEKVQIKPEELPEAVRTTLAGDEYKGWAITTVYQVKAATPYYEVNVAKEKETKVLKFSADGKAIK